MAETDQSPNPFMYGNLPLNSPLSPYLNVNPSIFKEPQYIMPEGAGPKRGRFEMAFSTIGSAAIMGAFLGGANGFFKAFNNPEYLKSKNTLDRRSILLNNTAKPGGNGAQRCGVLAFLYCGSGVLISYIRGVDDELNTMAAGAIAGAAFNFPSGTYEGEAVDFHKTKMGRILGGRTGLHRAAKGGLAGFVLATAWCLAFKSERMKQMVGFS